MKLLVENIPILPNGLLKNSFELILVLQITQSNILWLGSSSKCSMLLFISILSILLILLPVFKLLILFVFIVLLVLISINAWSWLSTSVIISNFFLNALPLF